MLVKSWALKVYYNHSTLYMLTSVICNDTGVPNVSNDEFWIIHKRHLLTSLVCSNLH